MDTHPPAAPPPTSQSLREKPDEQLRREPAGPARCLNCGYVIENLVSDRCPECGQSFDLTDRCTYTTRPPFLLWKFWLPGLLLAVICGLGSSL